MKFYKSTAGCGYNEYAIVTPINEKDYLCIWTNENSAIAQIHVEGEIVEDLHDIYLEPIEINMSEYEICNSFLFKFWMENNKLK